MQDTDMYMLVAMCRHDGDELMMFPKAGVTDSLKTALRLTKNTQKTF